MKLLYEETLDGISVRRCYGLDGIVQIPDRIDGKPVTGLEGYLFSETVRGRGVPPHEYEGEPELCGSQVKELVLPRYAKRIGAYAFYNCSGLRKLSCQSTVDDWGAGVFTGCTGIASLDICVREEGKSCFREILSELRQTLDVDYRREDGTLLAKLVFPEYFEESVENTPARIIMREMHGCGHMYRYCFDGTLYRLYWPWGLKEEAAKAYQDYIAAHAGDAAEGILKRGERDILGLMARSGFMGRDGLGQMLDAASRGGNAADAALLMDIKHERFGHVPLRARTFEL